jgi:GxxExxY protein
MNDNAITEQIIGAAIEVHRALGPGLLESAYEACLVRELTDRRLPVERQKSLPVTYKGERVDCGYRMDLLVSGRVVVELKVVDRFDAVHQAQLLSYLRLANLNVGLLINFNVTRLVQGIRRVVHHHPEASADSALSAVSHV